MLSPQATRRGRQTDCRVRPGPAWLRLSGLLLAAGCLLHVNPNWAADPPAASELQAETNAPTGTTPPNETNAPAGTTPELASPTNAPPPGPTVPEPGTNTVPPTAAAPKAPLPVRIDSEYARLSARVLDAAKEIDRTLCSWFTPEAYETSRTLDRFFGARDDAGEDADQTCLRVTPGVSVSRENGVRPLTRFGLTLAVPQLSERLQLVAKNYQTDEDVLPEITDFFSRQRTPGADQESAGLRLNLFEGTHYALSGGAGLRFQPEPVPTFRLKGGINYHEGPWATWIEETGFWRGKDGFGEKTELIESWAYSKRVTIRTTEAALWQEIQPGMTLGATCSLRYDLHHDRCIGVTAAVEALTEPASAVNSYALRVPYQRRLYRDWLHLQIEPGLNLDKVNHFAIDPILTVALEFRFGYVPKPKDP